VCKVVSLLSHRLHVGTFKICRPKQSRKGASLFEPPWVQGIYSAFIVVHSRRSSMDHTVLPENYSTPAFTSQAFTRRRHHMTISADIYLQLTTHLGPYRWQMAEMLSIRPSWLTYSGRFTHNVITGWRAQDKESSTAYQCATQPTQL